MKERSILFSGPMVRAILEGRKTMTRRVIKGIASVEWWLYGKPSNDRDGLATLRVKDGSGYTPGAMATRCPYGQPGDRLWVKETFTKVGEAFGGGFIYREDKMFDSCGKGGIAWSWRPSIFMPRKASRITLEIVSVRVERLHDISEKDAKAEGAPAISFGELKQAPMSLLGGKGAALFSASHRYGFHELWNSINAKRGYGWDANPWVWVVEFKGVEA